jgi:hypothetical protein
MDISLIICTQESPESKGRAGLLVPILNELSFTDYLEPFDKFSNYLSRGFFRMA